jgi:hypothetical protein
MFRGAPLINYLLPLNQKLDIYFTVTSGLLFYTLCKNYRRIFMCSSQIYFYSVGLIAGLYILAALSDAEVTPTSTSHVPVYAIIFH